MDTLVFPTDIQKLDVFFLLDTTGSMGGERENLKTGIVSVISSVRAIIPDTWMGVGKFEDYPVSPYGSAYSDDAFQHIRNVTDDATAIESGVLYIDGGSGGDGPESSVPAMYAVATGLGLGSYLAPQTSCASGTFGYPCFRNDAFPVIVLMTDALFHNGPGGSEPYDSGILGGHVPPTYEETVTELLDAHIKVISVNSGSTYGAPNCRQIAVDTHAVDSYGTPLYFEVSSSGTGIDTTIVDAIDILASDVPIDVSARARDGAGDSLDARVFVESITPSTTGGVADPVDPTIVCEGGLSVEDKDGDTVMDAFDGVPTSTPVCFDVTPARNTTVPATAEPQVFTLHVDIYGDGFMRLSTKEINFMVPPDFS
jgi:hypothetical protein